MKNSKKRWMAGLFFLPVLLILWGGCDQSSDELDHTLQPNMQVEKQSYQLDATEQELVIRYTIENPIEGHTPILRKEGEAAWVHIEGRVESGYRIKIDKNRTEEERTAQLLLTYAQLEKLNITLQQEAGGDFPDPDPDPTPDPDPDPTPDPDPDPTPDPDPDPTPSGEAYRTGWAELPAEEERSDYYYAHHLTDLKMKGNTARNYTVCYSATHHCPVWVAAPRHAAYEGSTNRTDAYQTDPQIPANLQYHSKSTGGGCNKGHMLGSAERTASRKTNEQVFYYTNIAPQYQSGFNTGGGGWNTLEDWMDEQVCADTTYLVIGTYFDRYTDGYGVTASPKKIEFGDRSDVSCPTMFYMAVLRTKRGNTGKSVIDCTASELKCAAFVRTHSNEHKGQKVTRKEMMSIADLEKLTGHRFFVNVPHAPKESFNPSDWNL